MTTPKESPQAQPALRGWQTTSYTPIVLETAMAEGRAELKKRLTDAETKRQSHEAAMRQLFSERWAATFAPIVDKWPYLAPYLPKPEFRPGTDPGNTVYWPSDSNEARVTLDFSPRNWGKVVVTLVRSWKGSPAPHWSDWEVSTSEPIQVYPFTLVTSIGGDGQSVRVEISRHHDTATRLDEMPLALAVAEKYGMDRVELEFEAAKKNQEYAERQAQRKAQAAPMTQDERIADLLMQLLAEVGVTPND